MKAQFCLCASRNPQDPSLLPGFEPHASARLSFIASQARRLVAPLLPLFLLFLANGELRAQAPLQGGQQDGASAQSPNPQSADLESIQYAPAKPRAYGPPLTVQTAPPQPAPPQPGHAQQQSHAQQHTSAQQHPNAQQQYAQLQYAQKPDPQPQPYSQPGYVQQDPYAQPQPHAQQQPNAQQQAYAQQQQTYAQQQYAQPQPYPQQQQYPQPQPYAQQPYPAHESPQPQYAQAQPPAQPLTADQLEQLVAPIALYPDTLLAEVLAAATYPAQVIGADHWLQGMQAQGYGSPDQVAAGADAQTWDPSVKALTAFPQVLAQMDQALQWTTDLGNAYYNQPQDLLQTVQVMRQRAQSAGNLEDSPQEQVSYDQGYIQLDPPNPQVVYVPAYNPWDVYGQPVSPYPGFSLLGSLGSFAGAGPVRFGMGIAMAAFNHTPFGWMGWALDWLSQSILFNHQDYYSRSTTVARWGGSRGGYPRAGLPRQPEGYGRSQAYQQQGAYARPSGQPQQPGYAGSRGYAPNSFAQGSNRGYGSPNGNFARPAIQNNYAYNRMPARPQQSYARPGYASGFYGGAGQGYANRPGSVYSSPQQNWRSAAPVQQRGGFAQRSYAAPAGRGFMESPGRQEHSGGFHLFGGGHSAAKSYGGGHAPRSFGGGRHSGGGGHSGGHSGGGHRR